MRYLFILLFLVVSTKSGAEEVWTIQDLLNYAFENSPSLNQAKLDVGIANLDQDIARQDHRFGFTLDVQSFTGFSTGRRVVVGGVIVSEDIGDGKSYIKPFLAVIFGFPIFREGKFIFQNSISEEVASVNLDQSKESYDATKQELTLSISDVYLDIIFKKKELEILNENWGRLKNIVDESKERLEHRLITQADFLEADHQLTELETEIRLLEMDSDLLQKQLANLIGMSLSEEFPELKVDLSTFDRIKSDIPDFNTLWSWAQEDNPDLAISILDVQESNLNLKLSKRNIFPELFLTGTSAFSTDDSAHFFGLGIGFPIHELFKRLIGAPEISKSKLLVDKSQISLQAVRSSIELELMQAYTDWRKARESAISAMNKVRVKETRVTEGENRLRDGLVTTGEHLEFINSYEEASIEYQEKQYEEYTHLLTLLKIAGVIGRFLLP